MSTEASLLNPSREKWHAAEFFSSFPANGKEVARRSGELFRSMDGDDSHGQNLPMGRVEVLWPSRPLATIATTRFACVLLLMTRWAQTRPTGDNQNAIIPCRGQERGTTSCTCVPTHYSLFRGPSFRSSYSAHLRLLAFPPPSVKRVKKPRPPPPPLPLFPAHAAGRVTHRSIMVTTLWAQQAAGVGLPHGGEKIKK